MTFLNFIAEGIYLQLWSWEMSLYLFYWMIYLKCSLDISRKLYTLYGKCHSWCTIKWHTDTERLYCWHVTILMNVSTIYFFLYMSLDWASNSPYATCHTVSVLIFFSRFETNCYTWKENKQKHLNGNQAIINRTVAMCIFSSSTIMWRYPPYCYQTLCPGTYIHHYTI